MKTFFQKVFSEITDKVSIHALLFSISVALWAAYLNFWDDPWCFVTALLFTLLFIVNLVAQKKEQWKKSYTAIKIKKKFNSKRWRDKRYKRLTNHQKEILSLVYMNCSGVVLQRENTDVMLLVDSFLIRPSQYSFWDNDVIVGDGGGLMCQFFIQPLAETIIKEHMEGFQPFIDRITEPQEDSNIYSL